MLNLMISQNIHLLSLSFRFILMITFQVVGAYIYWIKMSSENVTLKYQRYNDNYFIQAQNVISYFPRIIIFHCQLTIFNYVALYHWFCVLKCILVVIVCKIFTCQVISNKQLHKKASRLGRINVKRRNIGLCRLVFTLL